MNKLFLIIKREYLSRVKKKSFIIATLLTPLGIAAIMFVSGYLASDSMNSKKKILVVDRSGVIKEDKIDNAQFDFELSQKTIAQVDTSYAREGYDLLLDVPPLEDLKALKHKILFYSKEKQSLITINDIEKRLRETFKEYKLDQSGLDKQMLKELEISINLDNALADGEEGSGDTSDKASIGIATGLSYIMGFLMYMVIFVYGSMVMRSVMEEKINRIVEVMISSVKPFQLMLGKVTGVGLVALTQLLIWIVLLVVGVLLFGQFFVQDPSAAVSMAGGANEVSEIMKDESFVKSMYDSIQSLNWALIIPSFIVFFFGGYFIYSSVFAAIGSAMGDDLGEGQQLMMPVVIVVVIAMSLIVPVMNNPNGGLAIFGSMFPLFSPIVMPARLPFDPPIWQVILSIVILIGSVVFMTWLAGRIYRVGILMYGKKVSFKELSRWMFYKG